MASHPDPAGREAAGAAVAGEGKAGTACDRCPEGAGAVAQPGRAQRCGRGRAEAAPLSSLPSPSSVTPSHVPRLPTGQTQPAAGSEESAGISFRGARSGTEKEQPRGSGEAG